MTVRLMRAVCLTHVPFEGPGTFATALTARGVSLEHYFVPPVGLLKEVGDLLIVIGAPIPVNDSDPSPAYQPVTLFPLASHSVDGSSRNTRSSGLNNVWP